MKRKTSSTVFSSLAALVAGIGLAVWLITGAHRGWSQTRIPKTIVDEITDIEAVVFEEGFVAGIDFLGAVLVLSAVLACIGWIIGRRKRS